jgi:RND superfamily putative drug exporter
MIAPTEVVLRAPRVAADEGRLTRFARALEREPEVGAVVGAGLVPVPQRYAPVLRTPSGDAVRWFVALRHDPYSAAGATDLGRLQHAMPRLLAGAGFRGTDVLYAGDTALARETISRVNHDLLWVGIAAALVNLVLLSLFLRALVAPVLLVATSAMAIAATFGITVFVFRHLLGQTDLTYFVPLAVGVLLLSFGTDYNLFVVGRIWQEAENRPIWEAIAVAVPRTSRAIAIAGIALAGSFGLLSLVDLDEFRQFAFALGAGVLIDTFVVRALLVPSLIAFFGDASWWPRRRRVVELAGEPA